MTKLFDKIKFVKNGIKNLENVKYISKLPQLDPLESSYLSRTFQDPCSPLLLPEITDCSD